MRYFLRKKLPIVVDILVSFIIVLLILGFCTSRTSTTTALRVDDTLYDQCASVIKWETSYDKELEQAVIEELCRIPEQILTAWLQIDCSITIVPNQRGYLDLAHNSVSKEVKMQVTDKPAADYYTIAYNDIRAENGKITSSHIYILGNEYSVRHSVLHEMGHFVYYETFGIETAYVLPNYETNYQVFINNECDGNTYLANPGEYFAEVFVYTITSGTRECYPDTVQMQEIIDNFNPEGRKSYTVP